MSKILKNTTVTAIELDRIGITIPALGQETLKVEEYMDAASPEAITEITPYLNSGAIVVNDGLNDLVAAYGIYHLLAPEWAFNQRFLSEPERSNGFFKKTTQEAIEEGRNSFEGKGFQVTFLENGTVLNEWMANEDSNIPSNESPKMIKYKARLVGINVSNVNTNSDPIILIAVREYPYTNLNDIDRAYKWTLTNVRAALRTNQSLGFEVNVGDLLAVYVVDGGGNSSDMVLTMDFIVIEASDQDIVSNFSGNFNSSDFPAIGSIPEVLT